MNDDECDLLFHAMASRQRRDILEAVRSKPGCKVIFVAGHFGFSRSTMNKRVAVLESANLLITPRSGRARVLYFNPVPLQQVHEAWTDPTSQRFATWLVHLKRIVEKKGK